MPGQRVVFARNPHYFGKAPDGAALPYLDRITVEIIPDQNAELLRLEAGQIDMTTDEMRPEDYAPLKRAADAGRVKLLDLGVATTPTACGSTCKPGAFASDPRAAWLQRDELRRAISMAVDRKVFADTVLSRRRRAGLRPDHAGQQDDGFRSPRRPAGAATTAGR